MKVALLTGSNGFIGRHMRHHLESAGWFVVGCDLAHGHDCRDLFAQSTDRFDLVVHCAAVVGGRLTISHAPMAVAVDLELDAAMFRWAVRTRQPRIVYFSSSAAYRTSLQRNPNRRLREDDIDLGWDMIGMPDMTYGWAKLTGELLARYAEAEGVPVHVLRPFSGYGPGQSLDYPFPSYVDRAQRRADPFDVWGDGGQARDFVHVDDICRCVLAVVAQDYRQPLNIGTGRACTFNELADVVCREAGYRPTVRNLTDKPVGPRWRVADVARMVDVYQSRVTLEDGITQAFAPDRAA